jgi:hypothetical protein
MDLDVGVAVFLLNRRQCCRCLQLRRLWALSTRASPPPLWGGCICHSREALRLKTEPSTAFKHPKERRTIRKMRKLGLREIKNYQPSNSLDIVGRKARTFPSIAASKWEPAQEYND